MMVKLRRLWIQLSSDRKRFGTLCAALVIGMLLWARLIVVSRMPRMAIATENAPSAANAAGKAAASKESGSTGVAGPATSTPMHVALELDPQRDPFVISPRYFPKSTLFAPTAEEAGKSPPKQAEDASQVQSRITAQLQALVDRMRLDAAVSGSIAVIDGRTYRVGEWVPAPGTRKPGATTGDQQPQTPGSEPVRFRLAEVRLRSAILEWEDRRFEISMASPGGVDRK